MGKEKKPSIFKKILFNVYLKNILLMVVILVAIVYIVLYSLDMYTRHNDTIEVPNLKGLQVQDVEAIVKSANLRYEVVDSVYQKEGTPGSILEQIPKEKSEVKEGRTIYLTVQALNEPLAAIPNVENTSLRQAQAVLKSLGFTNVNVILVPSDYQDLVLSVEHKGKEVITGQKIPKGSALTLKVGNGLNNNSSEIDLSVE